MDEQSAKLDFDEVRVLVAALPEDQRKKMARELILEFIAQAEDPRKHRKPYRKREELPDPTQSANAAVNNSPFAL